jgi:hypothetical protein
MTNFSIGDRVRCIDTSDTDLSEFTVYTVVDVHDDDKMVSIEGVDGEVHAFFASRFMLDDELADEPILTIDRPDDCDCSECRPDLYEDYLHEMDTLSDDADYLEMAIDFIERNYSAEPEDDEAFLAVSELMRAVFGINVGIRPTAYEFTFSQG